MPTKRAMFVMFVLIKVVFVLFILSLHAQVERTQQDNSSLLSDFEKLAVVINGRIEALKVRYEALDNKRAELLGLQPHTKPEVLNTDEE
jgi:hypothetical protein